MNQDSATGFPALLDIEYPDQQLNWVTTFFRPFTVIPVALILALLSGPAAHPDAGDYSLIGGGILWLPTMLMLVFRQKYPRWWFEWNLELMRFSTRVCRLPGAPP